MQTIPKIMIQFTLQQIIVCLNLLFQRSNRIFNKFFNFQRILSWFKSAKIKFILRIINSVY